MQFEVTLKGYDGGTDKTDHLVKWVIASSLVALEDWLDKSGLRPHVQGYYEMTIDTLLTFDDGIDVYLSPGGEAKLEGKVDFDPQTWIDESLAVTQ